MDIIRLFADGFPLTIERLQFLQNTYIKALAQLSKVAGSGNLIIDGVVVAGASVSSGVIIIDGELLEFEGGAFNARVAVFETVDNVPYNIDADNDGNLDEKVADVVRTARCAATGGVDAFNFSTLVRVANLQAVAPQINDLKTVFRNYDPVIDAGWLPCDGTNGTPNLQDRYLVGAGNSYDVGDEVGQNEVALTRANLPNFNMAGTSSSSGGHRHNVGAQDSTAGFGTEDTRAEFVANSGANPNAGYNTNFAPDHTHNFNVNSGGSDTPHENKPASTAVTVLIFKGL